MEELVDFVKILVPASIPGLIAILIWIGNTHSDRKWEQYKRKEERYIALLNSLEGFYVSASPNDARTDKEEFIRQLNDCWLYCPDPIVISGYAFLDQVRTGVSKTDEEKNRLLENLSL